MLGDALYFKGSSKLGDLVFKNEYLAIGYLLSLKLCACLKHWDNITVQSMLFTSLWYSENIIRCQMGDVILWADDRNYD